jgi:hypothetical protein
MLPLNNDCKLGILRVSKCRKMTPALQTSALVPYGWPQHTSGACEVTPSSTLARLFGRGGKWGHGTQAQHCRTVQPCMLWCR